MDEENGRSRFRGLFGRRSRAAEESSAASEPEYIDERFRPKYSAEDYDVSSRFGTRDSITPDFTADALEAPESGPKQTVEGQASGAANQSDKPRRRASSELSDAEDAAANQGSTKDLDAQSGESNVPSSHVNNVGKSGATQEKGDDKKSGGKSQKTKGSILKGKGPITTIILSLLFGGGGMFLGQSALPFTMLDKINGLFDTTNTMTEMRSSSFTKRMIRNNSINTNNVTKKNVFGKEKFKPTRKMKKKLSKQGITFEGGNMIYKTKSGATEVMDVKAFKAKLDTDNDFRAAYTKGTKNWRTSVAEFKDKMFDKLLKKFGLSKNKFSGYNAEDDPDGEKARKQMAQDADEATDMDAKARKATEEKDADGKSQTTGKNNTGQFEEIEVDALDANGNPIKDQNGNTVKEKKQVPKQKTDLDVHANSTDETSSIKPQRGANGKVEINHSVSEKMSKVASVAGTLSTFACGFSKALSALSLIMAAYQVAQVLAVAQTIFEGVDKARTEDANSSPINAIGKSLTMQTSETKHKVKETNGKAFEFDVNISTNSDGSGSAGVSGGDESDTEYEEVTLDAKSATQSEGFNYLFTGDRINGDDESVSSFNPTDAADKAIASVGSDFLENTGIGGSLFGGLLSLLGSNSGFGIGDLTKAARTSYVHCIQIELALAALDVIIDATAVVEVIVGFFTFGAGAVVAAVQEAAWNLLQAALMALVSLGISMLVAWITPKIIDIFTRKLATEFAGEDLGNAIVFGGHELDGSNHRAGGGLVASKKGYLASLIYNDKVLQDTGRNERLARSPFDYTSAYTFAGQLASATIPITMQSSSLLDSFGNFGKVVSNSVKSLFPSVSAASSAAEKAEYAEAYTEKHCPELADIGAVGDAFCSPYVTTDFETMDLPSDTSDATEDDAYDYDSDDKSPLAVVKQVANEGGFKDNSNIDDQENPEIDLDSNLGKYVVYCGQRTSQFGQPDQNIISEVQSGSTGSMVGDAAVGIMPIAGGIMSIISSGTTLGNWGWVDGSNCVMDHDDPSIAQLGAQRVDYDEIKIYNRYVEDQRLAESMGIIEQSAVSKALDEYYEKNPLDNSPEGILARYSGLTKENVIAVLDTAEVYAWYSQYDPTDSYPTPAIHEEDPDYRVEDNRLIEDDGILAYIRQGFDDFYRQRNFATA